VIVDSRITAASPALKHGADIGRAGRIGENRLSEILGREIATNGKGKKVDHLVDMRADEVGPEDSSAALLDQRFVGVHGFSDPVGREPVRDVPVIDPERKPCRPPLISIFFGSQPRRAQVRRTGGDR